MARLQQTYELGNVPVVPVNLETCEGQKVVLGEVDSGAACSLFPVEVAEDLGMNLSDLIKTDQQGQTADGRNFDTWAPPLAVMGQVQIVEEGGFSPWGPLFKMRPQFADTETFLLGSRDFFAAFHVRFLHTPHGALLELEDGTA